MINCIREKKMEEIELSNNTENEMTDNRASNDRMTDIPSKIFLIAMFLAYPLVFRDYYYDIVTCKYVMLICFTLLLLVGTLLLNRRKIGTVFRLSSLDFIIISLFFLNLLSILGSDYKLDALNGSDGRNNGVITVFLYMVIFIIVSRGTYNRNRFFLLLAVGSIPVSLLGNLNFANIDFLGFYDGLQIEQKQFYMSTLGHVNVYSSYFALTIPVLLNRYLETNRFWERIFYFLTALLNIAALLCGGCESAGLILGVAAICVIFSSKRLQMLKWICLVGAVLVLNKCFIFINENSQEKRVISQTMQLFEKRWIVLLLLGICLLLLLGEWLLTQKNKVQILRKSVLGVLIVIPVLYLGLFFWFSCIDRQTNLNGMEAFLRFSEEFGSYRGYIWKVVVQEFKTLSPYQKLFGIGTDVLRPYLVEQYGANMYHVTMAYYDNAHNEYLQYLITTGIFGLGTYCTFVGMQIRKAVKCADKVLLCSVICYLIQATVNLNQVVTTPLFLILLSMCGTQRKEEKQKTENQNI